MKTLTKGRRKGQLRNEYLGMTAEETINTFKNVLIPHHDEMERNHNVHLQYEGDCAPSHTSHAFMNFWDDEDLDHYPFGGKKLGEDGGKAPNSPDMSPIELLFHDWENAVAKRMPKTANELMTIAEEEWGKISIKTIRDKIRRMPKVYKWVFEHNGELYPTRD